MNPSSLEQQIRELSDQSFSGHKMTLELHAGMFRSWLCKNPGSSAYWFRITTIPGSLIITGDLGTMVVGRENDMLPWVRGCIDSTDYFAGKCQDTKTRVFSETSLREWLAEQITEMEACPHSDASGVLDTLHSALSESSEHGPDWFYEELQDVFEGSEPPSWTDWDSQFLWRRDAIRWFIREYDRQQTVIAGFEGETK